MPFRLSRVGVLAVVVAAMAGPAAAKAPAPESGAWPIEAVTVHPGKVATVERRTTTTLGPGRHTLRLPALPGTVRPESLQADLEAGKGVRIVGVDAQRRTQPALTAARERELKARIEELESRQASLTNRIAALDTRLGFIQGVADLPREAGEALLDRAGSPDKLAELWTAIGEGAERTREDRRALKAKKGDLAHELEALRQELDDRGTGDREVVDATVRLRVPDGARDREARIAVRYRVTGASWKPTYTARLHTEAGKLTLQRRLRVRQKSGEDWTGVALTVTTASPRAGEPRTLGPWWVGFQPEPGSVKEGAADMVRAPRKTSAGGETQVGTTDTGFTTRHSVSDRVDLPADNTPRTFPMADETLGVDLETRVRPQQAERGWVVARAKWDGEAPLPPGSLSRYRDGAFVGDTGLDRWRPGEERTLAFGVDPRIAVTHTAARDREGDAGWFTGDRRVTRQYRVGIANHRETPADVLIRYRIPEPKDDAIKVALTADTPGPDARDVADRPGVLAWRWTLGPGDERTLPIGFEVRYPGDRDLSGL